MIFSRKRTRPYPPVVRALLLVLAALPGSLSAGVVVSGQLIDARATIARRQSGIDSSEAQVPLADRDVVLVLRRGSSSGSDDAEWRGRTDSGGNFSIDTGLASLPPETRFVTSVEEAGQRLFSPFFTHSDTPQTIHLYEPTEDASQLRSNVTVRYNVDRSADPPSLHVRVEFRGLNPSDSMYVGTRALSGWREIFRVPLPEGAVVLENRGPHTSSPGWKTSEDGRWLVIDTPIPGLLDLELQGVRSVNDSSAWSVTYAIPGRQRLVQAFPVPFAVNPASFAVWCLHKDQVVESNLLDRTETFNEKDPLTGRDGQFDVTYNRMRGLQPGETVIVTLTTDNLPLKQVSRSAFLWVGSFVLVVVLCVALGLLLGPRETPPALLFRNLSGEEVLDRIADFDRRFEAGEIRERDYRRYREALVELAAEELAGEGGKPSARPVPEVPSAGAIPEAAQRIIDRISELDAAQPSDPATIAERTQLLDALYKALPKTERASRGKR